MIKCLKSKYVNTKSETKKIGANKIKDLDMIHFYCRRNYLSSLFPTFFSLYNEY